MVLLYPVFSFWLLAPAVLAAKGLSMLVEATRLDERPAAARRLGVILAIISALLAIVYLYINLVP